MALTKIALVLSTGLGSGLVPKAPGTAGSVAALGFWLIIAHFIPWNLGSQLILVASIFILGICSCNWLYKSGHFGLKDHDHPSIVIDEWCGVWIAVIGFGAGDQWFVIAGFILFRLFDITKPWLVGRAEKLPGSWGVMMDDVVAGIFARIILLLVEVLI